MLNNKDYCDYDTCVALREIGYDAPQRLIPDYFGVFEEPQYDEKIHLYDAQKWLRDKRLMFVQIHKMLYGGYRFHVLDLTTYTEEGRGEADEYEDALLEGIKEAVKLLKDM